MGGVQAMLSIALIAVPTIAGLTFDQFGAGAPYAFGAAFALAALVVAWMELGGRASRSDSARVR